LSDLLTDNRTLEIRQDASGLHIVVQSQVSNRTEAFHFPLPLPMTNFREPVPLPEQCSA
jgi:hypothetical protein